MNLSSVNLAPPPLPMNPPAFPATYEKEKITTVSFSVQFDNEMEAVDFAQIMLIHIKEFVPYA